jgi:hypothetical protein
MEAITVTSVERRRRLIFLSTVSRLVLGSVMEFTIVSRRADAIDADTKVPCPTPAIFSGCQR